MTITIHFQWWMIPMLITVLSFSGALFWPFDDVLSGLTNLFAFVPASILSMISWIIAGALK